jgi:hypothetical protein
MVTITVRGLNDAQVAAYKQKALKQGISISRLALRRLTNAAEVTEMGDRSKRMALAGTWGQGNAKIPTVAVTPLQ